MYARFNLNPENRNWSEYINTGRSIHRKNKEQIELSLDKFKNADESLDAQKIIDNWFPEIKADVFLSHSHKDENTVIGFAGWLKEAFGLDSFMDSEVWGYSDDLLKAIDDKYCRNNCCGTYNYEMRNRSTSHVHMMLSTALMNMIDKCECIIFMNTPNSYKPKEYFEDEGRTESPWIYSEIAMTKMLRQRSILEHRPQLTMEGFKVIAKGEEARLEYPMDTLHLTPLSINDLDNWKIRNGSNKFVNLDVLYEMKAKK